MQFDREYFDQGINRIGTRSEKWDLCREEHGAGVLPLWVADMDFPSPPAVQEALLHCAAMGTWGYTEPLADDYAALTDFWQRRHGLTVTQEEVTLLPCVITGMKVAILASTEPGDGVIIMPPVYGPFFSAEEATGRVAVHCPLTENADGRYEMDFDAIEKAMQAGAKALLLCNPHNPVGRLWAREELTRLTELCAAYGVTLISDEIHADFALDGRKFTPVLSLAEKNVVSLCAASKTFNLAGLQQAACLCRDEALREKIRREITRAGVRSGNMFALEGTRAAYQHGDAWLDGLTAYLAENRDELAALVQELLPRVRMTPLEATYLCWLDLSDYGLTCEELEKRCDAAGVCFTGGTFFGKEGEYHLRVNIACPRRYLREGMLRLKKALEN